MNSIFDVERRSDLRTGYLRIINLAYEKRFNSGIYYYPEDLWEIIDEQIRKWKYKGNANNHIQFLNDINITCYRGDVSEDTMMAVMEFLLNMCIFICEELYSPEDQNIQPYKNIIENITYTLESINYQVYKNGDRYQFTKRNSDADSVMTCVDEDGLALQLLNYCDFRIRNDAEEKNPNYL